MPVVLQDLGPLESLTDLLVAPNAALAQGRPLCLPLSAIDEDPDQPRTEFDLASLHELAQTIRQRGVLQPISVRVHQHDAGRWTLTSVPGVCAPAIWPGREISLPKSTLPPTAMTRSSRTNSVTP